MENRSFCKHIEIFRLLKQKLCKEVLEQPLLQYNDNLKYTIYEYEKSNRIDRGFMRDSSLLSVDKGRIVLNKLCA